MAGLSGEIMNKRRNVQHGMQGVFVFVLLGLFALMSILLVLYGAQMYRTTVARAEENNAQRVLTSYIRSMVRAEDAADSIRVEDRDGVSTIAMYEEISGKPYVTWIYTWDGSLCEQFTAADRPFVPGHGTVIAAAGGMTPEIENGLLTVSMTDGDGKEVLVQTALYSAA